MPKLGWYEWFFVTPSNHRVHHAQNPVYMDRNYGGVFILGPPVRHLPGGADEQPVVFGVTTPLRSWNPLWANLQFYVQLWRDAVRAGSWWDRLRIWFMPTGWRPADVAKLPRWTSRTWPVPSSSSVPLARRAEGLCRACSSAPTCWASAGCWRGGAARPAVLAGAWL